MAVSVVKWSQEFYEREKKLQEPEAESAESEAEPREEFRRLIETLNSPHCFTLLFIHSYVLAFGTLWEALPGCVPCSGPSPLTAPWAELTRGEGGTPSAWDISAASLPVGGGTGLEFTAGTGGQREQYASSNRTSTILPRPAEPDCHSAHA